MATSEKKSKFFDDSNDAELVCLSSDTDEEEFKSGGGGVSKVAVPRPSKAINGNGGPKVNTLLNMGFEVRRPLEAGSPATLINGGGSNTSTTTTTKPNVKSGSCGDDEPQVFTLDDDDEDSQFEIEYSRNDDSISGQASQAADDSDDEIQVLEDGGPLIRFDRKRTCQESRVNLGVPGLNLGLIAACSSNRFENNKFSSRDIEEVNCDDETDSTDAVKEVDHSIKNNSIHTEELKLLKRVDYAEKSHLALVRFINEFCARKHRGIKKDQLNKAKQKMLDAFEKIRHFHEPIHVRLKQDIEDATNIIRCTPDQHWKTVKNLLDLMDPKNVSSLDLKTEDERNKERERKKMELRIKYEKELSKMQKKIRKLEETEVDWDDEDDHNSSYILGDKYKSKLIGAYYTLCDLSNCNHFTGRPTQTRINLRKHNGGSNIEAIDTAVEKFINKKGFMFAPDYTDILEIITDINQSRDLGLTQDEVLRTAQQMFENVVKIIKKRREKDFKISMLALLPKSKTCDSLPPAKREDHSSISFEAVEEDDSENMEERLQDPAEVDAELRAKLEENDKLKGSEAEVIEKFYKMAEGQLAAVVEDENANDSPPPSDNEDEDDYEDEVDTTEVCNDHEHEELTEDEDEEAETVSSGWKGIVLPTDVDDDNSNEGKTTAESESDNNVDATEESATGNTQNDVPMAELPAPLTTITEAPLVATKATANTGVESENEKAVATSTDLAKETEESSDDIQPPPAKRMRPDENFNEDVDSNIGVLVELECNKAAAETLPV